MFRMNGLPANLKHALTASLSGRTCEMTLNTLVMFITVSVTKGAPRVLATLVIGLFSISRPAASDLFKLWAPNVSMAMTGTSFQPECRSDGWIMTVARFQETERSYCYQLSRFLSVRQ